MSHPAFPRSVDEARAHFQPFIAAIVAVAHGDDTRRAELSQILGELDNNGWHIRDATLRIWAGERDSAALTASLDAINTALVETILSQL